MIVWILTTKSDTTGEYQVWEKRYLSLTQGLISQTTATEGK